MTDITQTSVMVGMARKDLRAVRGMMDHDVFDDEIFGFHVQHPLKGLLTLSNTWRRSPPTWLVEEQSDGSSEHGGLSKRGGSGTR